MEGSITFTKKMYLFFSPFLKYSNSRPDEMNQMEWHSTGSA